MPWAKAGASRWPWSGQTWANVHCLQNYLFGATPLTTISEEEAVVTGADTQNPRPPIAGLPTFIFPPGAFSCPKNTHLANGRAPDVYCHQQPHGSGEGLAHEHGRRREGAGETNIVGGFLPQVQKGQKRRQHEARPCEESRRSFAAASLKTASCAHGKGAGRGCRLTFLPPLWPATGAEAAAVRQPRARPVCRHWILVWVCDAEMAPKSPLISSRKCRSSSMEDRIWGKEASLPSFLQPAGHTQLHWVRAVLVKLRRCVGDMPLAHLP